MSESSSSVYIPSCRTVVIDSSSSDDEGSSGGTCLVCGEAAAAMHYGAMACVGCKGFFRRALMKADQLECVTGGKCVVNKDLRTNCRSCRFRKCLEAGMKPAAVRPNRDYSSRQKKKALAMPAESADCSPTTFKTKDDWMKKLTVEMRTMLMNLLNIEAKIMKGDTSKDAAQLYPLKVQTLRQVIADPTMLKGKRSEMRYEPYRMAKNNELSTVAYRRLIAAVDWVEYLAEELLGGLSVDDKIALVKNCFAPLMVFKFASRTAEVAKDDNILCLCNFAFVPRDISSAFSDAYHLGNGLVGRALDELVMPYRSYGMKEEEIVCVSAMIALNPLARDLSPESFEKILELRNRVQDTLFTIVKEARMSAQPSICFGHILLSLPIVTCLANTMCENLQFAQTFSAQGEIPLLTDLFGCFPVEPFSDDEETSRLNTLTITGGAVAFEKGTQTEQEPTNANRAKKRRHDGLDDYSPQHFSLLRPPGNYTLTEMFDDLSSQASTDAPEPDTSFSGARPGGSFHAGMVSHTSIPRYEFPSRDVFPLTRTQSNPHQLVQPQQMVPDPYSQVYAPPPQQFMPPYGVALQYPPPQQYHPSQCQNNNNQNNTPQQWNGYR